MLKKDESPFQILQWLASIKPGPGQATRQQRAIGFLQQKARDPLVLPLPIPSPQGRKQIIYLPQDGGLPPSRTGGGGTTDPVPETSSSGSTGSETGSSSSSSSSSSPSSSSSSDSPSSGSGSSGGSSSGSDGSTAPGTFSGGSSVGPPADLCDDFDFEYRISDLSGLFPPLHRLLGKTNFSCIVRGGGTLRVELYDDTFFITRCATGHESADPSEIWKFNGLSGTNRLPVNLRYSFYLRETVTCDSGTGIKTASYTGSVTIKGDVTHRTHSGDLIALETSVFLTRTASVGWSDIQTALVAILGGTWDTHSLPFCEATTYDSNTGTKLLEKVALYLVSKVYHDAVLNQVVSDERYQFWGLEDTLRNDQLVDNVAEVTESNSLGADTWPGLVFNNYAPVHVNDEVTSEGLTLYGWFESTRSADFLAPVDLGNMRMETVVKIHAIDILSMSTLDSPSGAPDIGLSTNSTWTTISFTAGES